MFHFVKTTKRFYLFKNSKGFLYPDTDLENLCLREEVNFGAKYDFHSCKLYDRKIYDEKILKKDGNIDIKNAPDSKAYVLILKKKMFKKKNEEKLEKYILKIRKHKELFYQKEVKYRLFYPDEVFDIPRTFFH